MTSARAHDVDSTSLYKRTGVTVKAPSWKPSCWHAMSAAASLNSAAPRKKTESLRCSPQMVPQPPRENISRRPNCAPVSDVPPPDRRRSPSSALREQHLSPVQSYPSLATVTLILQLPINHNKFIHANTCNDTPDASERHHGSEAPASACSTTCAGSIVSI